MDKLLKLTKAIIIGLIIVFVLFFLLALMVFTKGLALVLFVFVCVVALVYNSLS